MNEHCNICGLRLTRQKAVILNELKKVSSHPTAYEVYEMVRRKIPNISLATVYRNLEAMSQKGAVKKIKAHGAHKRFDGNPTNHYHVHCTKCGSVEDVLIKPITSIKRAFKYITSYEIEEYNLEFKGLCPACKNRNLKERKKSHGTKRI